MLTICIQNVRYAAPYESKSLSAPPLAAAENEKDQICF